jgi:hypothetical protein
MQQATLITISWLAALFVQLANMNKLNKKFIANEQEFKRQKYWNAERFSILGTVVFIFMFILAFPSAVIKYKISDFIQFICYAVAGGIGSVIFTYFLGRTGAYLKKQINDRTPGAETIEQDKTDENENK